MRVRSIAVALLLLPGLALAQQANSNRPSPPGTAEVRLGGKKITIEYSRPKVQDPQTGKKRKMIGEHDPYGKEWRTGANEATSFVTQANLDIGGTAVPAGSYTLYTLPEPNKWTLIVSKATGQWGIPYPGKEQDLARIPMKSAKSAKSLDQFTISLNKKSEKSADLVLAWEDWTASVPITVK
jgi:hypothetical protein